MEPATLTEAIAQQPPWPLYWMYLLGLINLLALPFLLGRKDGKWILRVEAAAILAAFFGAAFFMEWLYAQYGYVRLLGLAHLIFWTPVYFWILLKRRHMHPPGQSLFGKYLIAYLVIDGISLIIDVVDVVRYYMEG